MNCVETRQQVVVSFRRRKEVSAEQFQEFFLREASLLNDSRECSAVYLLMAWDDDKLSVSSQYNMASSLSGWIEADLREGPDDLTPRGQR